MQAGYAKRFYRFKASKKGTRRMKRITANGYRYCYYQGYYDSVGDLCCFKTYHSESYNIPGKTRL